MKKILGLALVCCLVTALATAQNGWQQDEAIGVVGGLLESLNRIVEVSPSESEQPDTVLSKKSHAALVDLRVLVEELEILDLALAGNNVKVQTFAQYQRISNLRSSIRDYASDMEIAEDIRSEADVAGKLMHELDLM